MNRIALVIPTNRPKSLEAWKERWKDQIAKHNVKLVVVRDGDSPYVEYEGNKVSNIEGSELVANHCAGVRNLGFLFVAQYLPSVKYIVTMDDDMSPHGDTIGDHIKTLQRSEPISWMSTAINAYMRGFPYQVREEAPVMLSHGIWYKNPDWDAPTQLLNNNANHTDYYKGSIPKGVLFNFCGMNAAFKREALPFVYYAPVSDFRGAERFDDIWAGIPMKRDFDDMGWAVYTGGAACIHERESNVFANLEKEAVGIRYNEEYWQDEKCHPWFINFHKKRKAWKKIMNKYV